MGLTFAKPDSDRRQGLRVRQVRQVKLFHPAANRYVPAQTLDLSPTGLRLSLPPSTPLTPGSLLDVHVAAPSPASPLVSKRSMIPARVVWVDRSETKLQVGLQYVAAASASAARVA